MAREVGRVSFEHGICESIIRYEKHGDNVIVVQTKSGEYAAVGVREDQGRKRLFKEWRFYKAMEVREEYRPGEYRTVEKWLKTPDIERIHIFP